VQNVNASEVTRGEQSEGQGQRERGFLRKSVDEANEKTVEVEEREDDTK